MDALLDDLANRARALSARHGLDISEEPAMCFSDPRLETFEQVCHELAHALQLGMDIDVKVSDCVGAKIDQMPKADQDLQEVRCFAIAEEVFWQLGVGRSWVSMDAVAAVEIQVDTAVWTRRKMHQEWSHFAYDALPLAERIAGMFRAVEL